MPSCSSSATTTTRNSPEKNLAEASHPAGTGAEEERDSVVVVVRVERERGEIIRLLKNPYSFLWRLKVHCLSDAGLTRFLSECSYVVK